MHKFNTTFAKIFSTYNMESLNRTPVPNYKIPFEIKELVGYLCPVDHYHPNRSYRVWIGEEWVGTLHNFRSKWHFSNKELQHIKEELGEFVIRWHQ